MTILQGLYQLLFGPLELLFELVYGAAYNIIGNSGAAIVPLSLCMNFLAFPFYNRADTIQKEERERERRLAPGIDHITKTFRADERYMMLQAFYRINGYKPVYALRSSLPLLLEIPFFVAAYHFLSNLPDLYGAQFSFLSNLGAPDGLLALGGLRINLLPILMTLINVLSSTVYTKGMSRKDKIQLYGISAIFLVLLYNSPSGLVFYWTLNQIFSLCKNLVYSTQNRSFVVSAIMSAMGVIFLAYAFAVYKVHDWNQLLVILIGAICQIPAIRNFIKKDPEPETEHEVPDETTTPVFIFGCVFLAVLTGLLIPSSVVRSSPAEFIIIAEYHTPLLYVFSAFLLAAGMFILWFCLFYYLADNRGKKIMSAAIWMMSILAVADYMLFGTHLGNLSAELKYDLDFAFSTTDLLINTEALIVLGAGALVVWLKKKSIVRTLFPVLIIAVFGMSVYNISGITAQIPQIKTLVERENGEKASFTLSRTGKNVIVFMLDRGICGYVPYLIQENRELANQFDGFTWYPNTLSYGTRTNTGSPALFGGYEYTPEEINKRNTEALVDKQNEALKVMPVLFDRAGYEVTVCDPPYAGYTWIPDLSIFDEFENVRTFNTGSGQFCDQSETLSIKQQIWKRNIFCYSIMKISPLILQSGLYDNGFYYNPHRMDSVIRQMQYVLGNSISIGVWDSFINSFAALCALPEMTRISDAETNTFLMMSNDTAHNVIMLQEPEYEPALFVNNTEYDEENANRFTLNGRTLLTDTPYKIAHYQCNMAAFIRLGKWFDYMRKQGVYDNTRIIIAADHGWPMEQFTDMLFGETDPEKTLYNPEDAMAYNPLLLVKDFGSTGFKIDNQFMTNADTPLLSMDGLIDNPVNPFTQNAMTDDAKSMDEQHVFYTDFWGTEYNNGNTFLPGSWYALKNHDIFDMDNWSKLGEY